MEKQNKIQILTVTKDPTPLPTKLTYTYNVTTLNINGLTSDTKISMLYEFLRNHNVDVICLQEVKNEAICHLMQYTPYLNVGTESRERQFSLKLLSINRCQTNTERERHLRSNELNNNN
jgi:hypothetical protein